MIRSATLFTNNTTNPTNGTSKTGENQHPNSDWTTIRHTLSLLTKGMLCIVISTIIARIFADSSLVALAFSMGIGKSKLLHRWQKPTELVSMIVSLANASTISDNICLTLLTFVIEITGLSNADFKLIFNSA